MRVALRAVSAAVTAMSETTTDYELLLTTIAQSVSKVLNGTCIVMLIGEDGETIIPVAMQDPDRSVMAAFATMLMRPRGMSDAMVAAVATAGKTLFMPVVDLAELQARVPADTLTFMQTIQLRGMIVVPLRVRGEMLGVLTVMRHRAELPLLDELDLELTEHLANHAALALANARMFSRLQAEHVARADAEQALEHLERLRRTEARALEATSFLDAIVENVPAMVFVKEADRLSFVRFNRAGEELLGVSRAELMGKNDYDFFDASEADFFVAKDRETLTNKALVDIPEEPIQTRNGRRWLHTKKVPIVDADGVPRFLLGISHDITDRKRDMAALQAAKDTAEAANRELEAFSYSVAHDLRAPLRAIDGFSQALLEDFAPKLGEIGGRYLERVRSSTQRMAALIDDLLHLSRVTRTELHWAPVDLAAIARTSIGVLQRAEPDRAVDVVIADGLATSADPKLLAIAFDNLLGNAWKFTSKRDRARIEVGTKLEAGRPVYYVKDDGAGFDMKYADKLFGVFQRLHSELEFPGTGIGLATVQRIVHRHGGRCWAESVVGQGATFYFTLSEAS